jgi:hypothetical protein
MVVNICNHSRVMTSKLLLVQKASLLRNIQESLHLIRRDKFLFLIKMEYEKPDLCFTLKKKTSFPHYPGGLYHCF